ncbi:MAG: hypothetical protein LBJ63_02800 [Prevotellaceae bacterium]|jgi:hypothetical protein|nr:hypothetical protein [Prevotellaceae bacterium]
MKKLIYLITFALLITACGKDDATIKNIDSKLIGTWELEYYYWDENGNPINFTDTATYNRFDTPISQLIFYDAADCGLMHKFSALTYINCSYYTDNNVIHITKRCNYMISDEYGLYANLLFLGFDESDVFYILNSNTLTIAYENPNFGKHVIYAIYKRKS